jgi:two-component system, cell cycle response regulator
MALKSASTTDVPNARVACLVVIYGEELGRIYTLGAPVLIIGRSSKCEIQIDQESISRNHSKVVNTGKSILIRDLGSTNGTYVNDEPIEEYVLRDGDLVKVGRTIFKFLSGGNIERGYHEEMYRLAKADQPAEAVRPGRERATTTIMLGADDDPGDGGPKEGG